MKPNTFKPEDNATNSHTTQYHYEIVVKGYLDQRWAQQFEGMQFTYTQQGTTQLYGPVPDQAALHAQLTRIRDLGLELISIQRHTSQDDIR